MHVTANGYSTLMCILNLYNILQHGPQCVSPQKQHMILPVVHISCYFTCLMLKRIWSSSSVVLYNMDSLSPSCLTPLILCCILHIHSKCIVQCVLITSGVWYCRGSLLRHTWTKGFLSNFTLHKCHKTVQDISTHGPSSAEQRCSADEDPQVETSYDIYGA